MAPPSMHCTCRTFLGGVFSTVSSTTTRASTLPPAFLIPAFAATQTSSFSTTASRDARKRKGDANPRRGVSALHRTGMRKAAKGFEAKLENLPKPVLDPSKRTQVETDPEHGLWEFFPPERTSMPTPGELAAHGGPWHLQHLRRKDWDDLHRLWWVCIKELNRIHTYKHERERVGNMYGEYESQERIKVIRKTMKSIKATLTERWYAWDNARYAAMEDEEIDMYADLDAGEKAYLPSPEIEEERPAPPPQDSESYVPVTQQPRI